jgi:hypothetical protein
MKKFFLNAIVALAIVVSFSACVERVYTRQYHQHNPEYYGRRHMSPPPGIDVTIHRRY